MARSDKQWYLIQRQTSGTPRTMTEVQVVLGRAGAEHAVEHLERRLSDQERADGWSHYLAPMSRQAARRWYMVIERLRARDLDPDRYPP